MKKELFERIVSQLKETYPTHKITDYGDIITASFLRTDGTDHIARIKECMTKGKSPNGRHDGFYEAYSYYRTVLYNPSRDSISVGSFETGWKWADRKQRYYPRSANTPVLCYSKDLYCFNWRDKKPRLLTGVATQNFPDDIQDIIRMIKPVDFDTELYVPLKFYRPEFTDDWQVIEGYTGVRVPKALRQFSATEVLMLVKVLRNPNELSTICQFLSSDPYKNSYHHGREGLFAAVATMMLGQGEEYWLIRDWVKDHKDLNKKLSLKIRSKTRIEDEHRKMSRLIMVKNTGPIKVHDHFLEMHKNLKLEAEIITDRKRLMKESVDQDHCVATYGHRINSGQCCILSMMWGGKRWTLQIDADKKGENHDYTLAQVKSFQNEEAPGELIGLLHTHFQPRKSMRDWEI